MDCPDINTIELCRATIWDNGKPTEPIFSRYRLQIELWTRATSRHDILRPDWACCAGLYGADRFTALIDGHHTRGAISPDYYALFGKAYGLAGPASLMGMFYRKVGGTIYLDQTFTMLDLADGLVAGGMLIVRDDVLNFAPWTTSQIPDRDGNAKPLAPGIVAQSRLDLVGWSKSFSTAPKAEVLSHNYEE